MRRNRILRSVTGAALGLAALAGPAAADWLVTRDGARIETRGAWEVRGRTVVFTTVGGTLSSMSLGDLDLDRSAELTAAAKAPPPAPAAAREARPVYTIGPHDVPQARTVPVRAAEPGRPEPGRPEPGRPEEDADEAAPGGPVSFYEQLEVAGWDKSEPSWLDGVELTGRLVNHNKSTATDISVTARIYDENGRPLGSGQAFLDQRALLAGRSLAFRVPFEGVADFATVAFDVSATEVVLGVGGVDAFDTKLPEGKAADEVVKRAAETETGGR